MFLRNVRLSPNCTVLSAETVLLQFVIQYFTGSASSVLTFPFTEHYPSTAVTVERGTVSAKLPNHRLDN
jgi:hypothetical protein